MMFTSPFTALCDETGRPLIYGKVYLKAGDEPAPIYQDAGHQVPRDNPVVLDSDGKIVGDIFTPAPAVSIVVADYTGRVIQIIDSAS